MNDLDGLFQIPPAKDAKGYPVGYKVLELFADSVIRSPIFYHKWEAGWNKSSYRFYAFWMLIDALASLRRGLQSDKRLFIVKVIGAGYTDLHEYGYKSEHMKIIGIVSGQETAGLASRMTGVPLVDY